MANEGKKNARQVFAEALGGRIAAAAGERGWKPPQAAKHLRLKLKTYKAYISGERTFPPWKIPMAAQVLGKPIHYFYGLPDPCDLNSQEWRLLTTFRGTADERKQLLLQVVEVMFDAKLAQATPAEQMLLQRIVRREARS